MPIMSWFKRATPDVTTQDTVPTFEDIADQLENLQGELARTRSLLDQVKEEAARYSVENFQLKGQLHAQQNANGSLIKHNSKLVSQLKSLEKSLQNQTKSHIAAMNNLKTASNAATKERNKTIDTLSAQNKILQMSQRTLQQQNDALREDSRFADKVINSSREVTCVWLDSSSPRPFVVVLVDGDAYQVSEVLCPLQGSNFGMKTTFDIGLFGNARLVSMSRLPRESARWLIVFLASGHEAFSTKA